MRECVRVSAAGDRDRLQRSHAMALGPEHGAPAAGRPGGRRLRRRDAVLLVLLVVAALAGAALDWILWEVYAGILVTLVAVPLLLVGGVGALVTRHRVRSALLVPFVIGAGLLLGQNLGPAREELRTSTGVVTVTLESPIAARASGPVTCTTVASGSEFVISGDPNMRLDSPERPFLSVYANVGDRWAQRNPAPRNQGVQFQLTVSPQEVPADGSPQEVRLSATQGTTLVADFGNDGGTIGFEGLAPDVGSDGALAAAGLDGAPFVGTVDWTCG